MTTQFEEAQKAHAVRARRLLALVEAATDVVDNADPGLTRALVKALDAYNLQQLRSDVEYYNREDARRAEEEAQKEHARTLAKSELPEARPRRQCEAEVATNMGRWTSFNRCDKRATRIALDRANNREREVCTVHARETVLTGKPKTGWYDDKHWSNPKETHPSWYRMQGWCMEQKDGRYCTVRVNKGTGLHDGQHRF